ncbi:hypothetical protein K2173_013398 [Erythroxylum novogranatense]|uniref:Late embryogenesis abundant protein LEA-2 subgroup domain-containing protein n=1 Tax=Erythroxylum novogranatense TaxID=1862640 RepID=A0AAV8S9X2_9ROSI|nr:hypothetical protein K2173_013398 [Erythroxylum novogranatense]
MAERDHVRPLAPARDRPSSDDETGTSSPNSKKPRERRLIKLCWCITAFLVIVAIVVTVLIFTIFRVKDPIIKMNGVTISKLELINGTIPDPKSNITLLADLSVKNPNLASFKYSNTTTSIFYHGGLVGEVRGPPGRAKPRRTMRMNLTVDIMTDRLISDPNLFADVSSGVVTMTSFSRVPGKMKFLKIIRKHVTVKMNCSLELNVLSQKIHTQKCNRKVDV